MSGILTPNTLSDPSLSVPFEGRGLNVNDRLVNINARSGTIICKKLIADEVNGGSGGGAAPTEQEVSLSSGFDVAAAGPALTLVDIPGMSLTLQPGSYLIGYTVGIQVQEAGQVLIADSLDNTQSGSISQCGTISTTFRTYLNLFNQIFRTITAETTYKLRVQRSGSSPFCQIVNESSTVLFTDPDTQTRMYAIKLA